ncbi:MAG: glycosyltransferase family 2 protein [Planctomycetota bacterium]|nr:glycosyltransferase family 2 protein [Planctomycetota bacterium]
MSDRAGDSPKNQAAVAWSVAVMCYNECGSLKEMVERTLATMRKTGQSFEVLIVDDGSTDGSGMIADELAAANGEVRVLHHSPNKGIGAVLNAGYRETRGDTVAILPADLQFAPEDLPRAMEASAAADVVGITRAGRHDPFGRMVLSFIDRSLVRLFFGVRAGDLHWVKLYRRRVLNAVTIESTTPMVDTELLVKAHRMNAKIVELPLPHHPRTKGQSHGAPLKTIVKTFVDLLKLRWRM